MLAMLVGALPAAHAQQVPDCLDDDGDLQHPTNNQTPGDDIIKGTPDRDIFAGGGGNDQIYGYGGSDVLCGNEGNDRIEGGGGGVFEAGKDVIRGGPGDDDLGGGDCPTPDIEDPTGKCPPFGDGTAGETSGVNYIWGDEGNDVIVGAGGRDQIEAGDNLASVFPPRSDIVFALNGNDFVFGGNGADELSGGSGSDLMEGGNDFDRLYGGEGNYGDDLYANEFFTGPIPQWPQTCYQNGSVMGTVTGPPESGQDTLPGLGNRNALYGEDGYDNLVGTARAEFMSGGLRGDDLYGFGSGDYLQGDRASDCLSGGPGHDDLNDADPNNVEPDDSDTLWGGDDSDHLNTTDGDSLDTLHGEHDGGPHVHDVCPHDAGDTMLTC